MAPSFGIECTPLLSEENLDIDDIEEFKQNDNLESKFN
jgi:hypothetical protein